MKPRQGLRLLLGGRTQEAATAAVGSGLLVINGDDLMRAAGLLVAGFIRQHLEFVPEDDPRKKELAALAERCGDRELARPPQAE